MCNFAFMLLINQKINDKSKVSNNTSNNALKRPTSAYYNYNQVGRTDMKSKEIESDRYSPNVCIHIPYTYIFNYIVYNCQIIFTYFKLLLYYLQSSSSSASSRGSFQSDNCIKDPPRLERNNMPPPPQLVVANLETKTRPSGMRPPSNLRPPTARSGLPRPTGLPRR